MKKKLTQFRTYAYESTSQVLSDQSVKTSKKFTKKLKNSANINLFNIT